MRAPPPLSSVWGTSVALRVCVPTRHGIQDDVAEPEAKRGTGVSGCNAHLIKEADSGGGTTLFRLFLNEGRP